MVVVVVVVCGCVCVCVRARARVLIVFTVALDFNKRCVEVVLKSKYLNRRNSDGPTIRLAQKEAYRLSATIKTQKTNRAHDVLQLLARKEEENRKIWPCKQTTITTTKIKAKTFFFFFYQSK